MKKERGDGIGHLEEHRKRWVPLVRVVADNGALHHCPRGWRPERKEWDEGDANLLGGEDRLKKRLSTGTPSMGSGGGNGALEKEAFFRELNEALDTTGGPSTTGAMPISARWSMSRWAPSVWTSEEEIHLYAAARPIR